MVKNIFFLIVVFLLAACSYKNVERAIVLGYVGGKAPVLKDYSLVYSFDGKIEAIGYFRRDAKLKDYGLDNPTIKEYIRSYCNVLVGNDYAQCAYPLRGKIHVKIFLKNDRTGNRIFVGEKFIDMDEYQETVLLTQVFIGSDLNSYVTRTYWDFEWDRAESIYSQDIQDTIYFYSEKLYKNEHDSNVPYVEEK